MPDKTNLEIEKEKKKELAQEEEYYKEVDKSSGWKYVKDTEDEKVKEAKKKTNQAESYVDMASGIIGYCLRLAEYGNSRIASIEMPMDWELQFIATDGSPIWIDGKNYRTRQGVVAILRSPKHKYFVKAFRATMNAQYDINAIHVVLQQIENTIDHQRGLLASGDSDRYKKTESGIYIPK